jgi:hypothetical protein
MVAPVALAGFISGYSLQAGAAFITVALVPLVIANQFPWVNTYRKAGVLA